MHNNHLNQDSVLHRLTISNAISTQIIGSSQYTMDALTLCIAHKENRNCTSTVFNVTEMRTAMKYPVTYTVRSHNRSFEKFFLVFK